MPFVTFHRNDQPDQVRAATGALAPVLVAETADGEIVVLLDGKAIAACAGSPEDLVNAVEVAVRAKGLGWPAARACGDVGVGQS